MYLIGLDFGTTNLKAVLFDLCGRIVRIVSRSTPTHYLGPGQAEFHPDEILSTVVDLLHELIHDFPERDGIQALSFASMAETGVALDRQGRPLAPALTWFDTRSLTLAQEFKKTYDPFELFQQTGVHISHIPSLFKILWEKKHLPSVYAQTDRWVFLCNYIAYRLTGELLTDPSQACRSMAFDIQQGTWSEEICSKAGINPGLFPPVVPTGQPMGKLLPDIGKRLGLKKGFQVVMGGHDHVCAALSTGLKSLDIATNSSGTVDNIFTLIQKNNIGRSLFDIGCACGQFLTPDSWYVMGGLQGAGKAVDWFLRTLYFPTGNMPENAHLLMMQDADQVPAGSKGLLFLPHLRGSTMPHKAPSSKGAFLGLQEAHSRKEMARAVFEGLSMEYRNMIDSLEGALQTSLQEIRSFGGGTRNQTWLKIKASVLNRPLKVFKTLENGCLGAALLAGVGSGLYSNLDAALDALQTETVMIEPDRQAASCYEELYGAVYRSVFDRVHTLHQKLAVC